MEPEGWRMSAKSKSEIGGPGRGVYALSLPKSFRNLLKAAYRSTETPEGWHICSLWNHPDFSFLFFGGAAQFISIFSAEPRRRKIKISCIRLILQIDHP
jgi:hypothetical protein